MSEWSGYRWEVLPTGIWRGFCRHCRLLVGRVFPVDEWSASAVRDVLASAAGVISLAGVEGSPPPAAGGGFEVYDPVSRRALFFDSVAAAKAEVEGWHAPGRCSAGHPAVKYRG